MNKQNKAALLVFLGGLVWSFTGLLSKLVSWSSFTLVGVRAIPALIVLGLGRGSFRIRPNKGLWISAAGITLTSLFYMTAIRLTSTANAIVLQYTASVFVILYMLLVKKQRPLKSEMIAAAFVVLGVCLCFGGSLGGGHLAGDLVALLSGASYAAVFLSSRYSGNDPVDGVYFGTLISTVFSVAAPFDPGFALTAQQLLMAVALGCGLGFGYLFFSLGMRAGISAVKASVISNVEPVLNPLWVGLLLGEFPGTLSIIGCAVVLLAVTLQSLYESARHHRT
ncbi:MAG: EamA family transporter [Clostridia bacterium]|nr:EamA family transporter [Clostridia bacterium]